MDPRYATPEIPYDYHSIMHYNNYAFAKVGKERERVVFQTDCIKCYSILPCNNLVMTYSLPRICVLHVFLSVFRTVSGLH